MRRYLTIILLVTLCGSATIAQTPKGKLYIEDSIAGGLHLYWLYLGDDGTFVQDPKNGADPINYISERKNNTANVGTYTKAGNKITAHFDNDKTEVWDIDYQNGVINTINGLYASVAKPMAAGYKLTGNYSSGSFMLNVTNIQTYTFNNNGTFNLKGMGAVNTSQTSATSEANGGGTYSIKGNTITLNFANGQKAIALICIFGTGPSAYLVINNSFFAQPK